MSNLADALVSYSDFLSLPERPDSGTRYQLHDGQVVIVPRARPLDVKIQKRIERLIERATGDRGVVTTEFPYRPGRNLQFWVADVAWMPQSEWDAIPPNDYPVYAPPLIVEVLSPSNTAFKVNRQRIVAMSAGTAEFWVLDAEDRTVQVTSSTGVRVYWEHEDLMPPNAVEPIRVNEIFAV
jgi:Uma2 family endonuclease